jgi:hypothetical protein
LKHTIIFLIPLLLLFSQVVHATNESSYKYGYKEGLGEFANCDDGEADCTAAPDDCQPTVYISTDGDVKGIPVFPADIDIHNASYGYFHYYILKNEPVTNKTACIDGFSHAWENSCVRNSTLCVALYKDYGFLPDGGVLRHYNGAWYRCDVFVVILGVLEVPFSTSTAPLQTTHNIGWVTDVVDGLDGINDRFLANELAQFQVNHQHTMQDFLKDI